MLKNFELEILKFKENSDWNILVVSKTDVDRNTERLFLYDCTMKLLELGIDADIILVSRDYYLRNRSYLATSAVSQR